CFWRAALRQDWIDCARENLFSGRQRESTPRRNERDKQSEQVEAIVKALALLMRHAFHGQQFTQLFRWLGRHQLLRDVCGQEDAHLLGSRLFFSTEETQLASAWLEL